MTLLSANRQAKRESLARKNTTIFVREYDVGDFDWAIERPPSAESLFGAYRNGKNITEHAKSFLPRRADLPKFGF